MKAILLINTFILSILTAAAQIQLPAPDKVDESLKIISIDEHHCVYFQGKGLGMMSASGQKLSEDMYFSIYPIDEKIYKVQKENKGQYALMSATGKLMTPFEFDKVSNFQYQHAVVSKTFQDSVKQAIVQQDGQIVSDWADKWQIPADQQNWTFKNQDKWGVWNLGTKTIFSQNFVEVKSFHGDIAPAKSQNLWGYINQKGEWLIPNLYLEAEPFSGKYAIVKTSISGYQLIDRKGNFPNKNVFDSIKIYEDGAYCIVYKNGKSTYLGFNGLPITNQWFISTTPFSNEGIATCKTDQKSQYLYLNGEVLLEADSLLKFQHGIGIFQEHGLWGWIQDNGEILQQAKFDSILNWNAKSVLVRLGDQIQLVNHSGKIIQEINTKSPQDILLTSEALFFPTQPTYYLVDLLKSKSEPLPYDEVGDIHDGVIVVKKDEQYGYIDIYGKEILSPINYKVSFPNHLYLFYQEKETSQTIAQNKQNITQFSLPENIRFLGPYQENKARIIHDKGLMGFIDDQGKIVVPCKYPVVGDYYQNRAIFTNLQGNMGYLDENGQEIIPAIYRFASNFDKSGFAAVIKDEKFGFIHTSGNVVIPFIYDKVLSLSHGIASVEQNGKVGYINMQNKKLIPFTFDEAYQAVDDLALVRMGIYWGYINGKGKVMIPWQYAEAQPFSEGKAWVRLDKKWGAIQNNGNFLIPLKYDQVFPFKNGYARVAINNKWGLLHESGKEMIPPICNQISEVYQNKVVVEINKTGYGIFIIP